MSNSIAPGSSADVNVRVTALTTNPNVPAQYKTIILKKNLVNGVNTLTQEMMSTTNTKYVVKYDYVLSEDIDVPENCILEFDGGSISGNGTNKDTITVSHCIITNGIFNNISILKTKSQILGQAFYISDCVFNVNTERIVIELSCAPEETSKINRIRIIGDDTDKNITGIHVGSSSTTDGCGNLSIENCFFTYLHNAIILKNETDCINISKNHFFRNLNDIYANDYIKTGIDIYDNHFQMGSNGWKSITFAGSSKQVRIKYNIIECANRTDVTFIDYSGGSAEISHNYMENEGSAEQSTTSIGVRLNCSNTIFSDCRISGNFQYPVVITHSSYTGNKIQNFEYIPKGYTPASIIHNLLIDTQIAYLEIDSGVLNYMDNLLGTFISPATLLQEGRMWLGSSTELDLSAFNILSIKICIFIKNVSFQYNPIFISLGQNDSGTITEGINYSYDKTTKKLMFSYTTSWTPHIFYRIYPEQLYVV